MHTHLLFMRFSNFVNNFLSCSYVWSKSQDGTDVLAIICINKESGLQVPRVQLSPIPVSPALKPWGVGLNKLVS